MATLVIVPPIGQSRGVADRGDPCPAAQDAPSALLADVARNALASDAHRLEEALLAVRSGDDPAAVHDARVASRRSRATLELLAGVVWGARLVRRLRRQLSTLARTLGDVRDADVFLAAVVDGAAAEKDPSTKRALKRARRRRERALRALRERLDAASTRRLLRRLHRLARRPEGEREPSAGDGLHVRDRAGSLLLGRYEVLRAHEAAVMEGEIEEAHRIRMDAKHLRYALELFEAALGSDVASMVSELVAAQDALGRFHDGAMGAARFEREDPSQERRLEIGHELKALHAEALARVRPIFEPAFARRLLGALAGLWTGRAMA